MVGDSTTGAIDKIDGVYFSFGAIQKLAYALPAWVRLPAPRIRGAFNVVPVDYVALTRWCTSRSMTPKPGCFTS